MIQTESTPNPNSLKFLSENVISAAGTEEFQKDKLRDLSNSFINELLSFKGVELVLLSKNFLSVKKNDDVSWNELKPMVISHLNHYFENNKGPILKDSADEINKKIKKAKSDSSSIPGDLKNLEKNPEAYNLINIYSEISKKNLDKVLKEMSGKEYSFLKKKLAEILIDEITPVGKEIKRLLSDKPYLIQILKKGTEKANIIAEENLKNIREKVGLI